MSYQADRHLFSLNNFTIISMIIQWLGLSCFKIQTKNKNQDITIVTDPFNEKTSGLKMPKTNADIATFSHDHDNHNNLEAIKNNDVFIVNTPGEFETKGVFIYGIPAFHDDKQGKEKGKNNIYKIITEDINLVHLGDLGQPLDDEQLEKVGNVDILFVPVGEVDTLNLDQINGIISQLEPRIIIPMHYKATGQKTELKNLEHFLKNSGMKSETMDKFKISQKELAAQTESKIVILNI